MKKRYSTGNILFHCSFVHNSCRKSALVSELRKTWEIYFWYTHPIMKQWKTKKTILHWFINKEMIVSCSVVCVFFLMFRENYRKVGVSPSPSSSTVWTQCCCVRYFVITFKYRMQRQIVLCEIEKCRVDGVIM